MEPRLPGVLLILLLLPVAGIGQALQAGDASPDFTLPYATRDSIARTPLTLSEYALSAPVLLAFYPADWSSGCTKEVCTLRDDIGELQDLNIQVLGISGDYVYSHHAWAKHHDLPFRLVSDHMHKAAREFGTFNEETGFTKRAVFVVGKDMRILYADPDYSVKDAADYDALKQGLRSLSLD